jgi:hypothetical protein
VCEKVRRGPTVFAVTTCYTTTYEIPPKEAQTRSPVVGKI